MSVVSASLSRQDRCNLQKALNEKTQSALYVDGDVGAKSVAALKKYQAQCNLPVTGEYDTATQGLLGPFIESKYIIEADFQRASTDLQVEVGIVKAFVEVEAAGSGFLNDGRCLILFERHKFYAALCKKLPVDKVNILVATNPNLVNPQRGGYMGLEKEWPRLEAAMRIDLESALLSASWGLTQIMGFNFAACGHTTVQSFVDAMKKDERSQLKAFVGFIKSSPRLHTALRLKDWAGAARDYNGSDYAKNKYDTRLAAAYASYK